MFINRLLFPNYMRAGMFHRYDGSRAKSDGGFIRRWLCRHGCHAVIWQRYRDSTARYGYCDWCKNGFEQSAPVVTQEGEEPCP